MTPATRIRVTMQEDGKTPVWELMIHDTVAYRFDGYIEALEHAVQAVSVMRYVSHPRPNSRG